MAVTMIPSLRGCALVMAVTWSAHGEVPRLAAGAMGWRDSGRAAIRGTTVGPIENALYPGRGYGTEYSAQTMQVARELGANWVSLTPFGRVADLAPRGISMTFETPFRDNRRQVLRAMEQAHREGLQVLLVPHLWVESGAWRGEIQPGDAPAWERWAAQYQAFVLEWAKVARDGHADMLAVGVELRTWVTSDQAWRFVEVIRAVRKVYPGLLTYAANWDDVEDTVVLGELDVIGINAFYPLGDTNGAKLPELIHGGEVAFQRAEALANLWGKPVAFTEFGYTARPDCGVRPWEWPEHLGQVQVDERAQAEAYWALLAPAREAPWFAGTFVWRIFADPNDTTQEADWGFSPRGKLSEAVLRSAYQLPWASDGNPAIRLLPGR